MLEKYIIGIDDSGRGNWIGSLVVAACAVQPAQIGRLAKIGVKDCKKMSIDKTFKIAYKLIAEEKIMFSVRAATPLQINKAVKENINLNQMEALLAELAAKDIAERIGVENILEIRINNPDPTPKHFLSRLNEGDVLLNTNVLLEHNNDETDLVVAAASVLAKFFHTVEYIYLKSFLGNFGNGFTSKETFDFVLNLGADLEELLVRKNYKQYKAIIKQKLNPKLI